MRTFLIIFFSLVILGGGFAVYVSMQKPAAKRPQKSLATAARAQQRAAAAAAAAASTTQSVHGIGSVDNPWVKRFENGELTSQFRSERSEPKGGDVVLVTRPQAEFFTGDGAQRLRIEGASGDVIVPGGGGGGGGGNQLSGGTRAPGGGGANMSPPSRGRLENVEISMYEPADAAEPMLVATMPNAVFDNDTFRISTEAYTDASGKRVEADQVPVVVRGRDYDFSGRGLVIRWNQLDRKLQLLEVAHGESLTVKNPDALSKSKLTDAAPARPATPAATAAMLASADPDIMVLAAAADPPVEQMTPGQARRAAARRAAATAAATRARPARDLAPVVYRASFDAGVQIFEAGKNVATADRLEIDILQPPHEDPATKPATADDTGGSTTTRAARRRRADETAAPASAPAVRGPVTVKWTGKLRVVPLEGAARDPALVPGKPIVRLTGAPVEITREDMVARSAVVAFNAADGSASLRANDIVPIVTMSLGDAVVTTPNLTYVQQPDGKQVATLLGASRAEMAGKGARDPLTLTWNKDGRIELIELANGKSTIERANFAGDVKIVHPDLDMTGQTLSLGFDPSRAIEAAATQPLDPTAPGSTTQRGSSGDDVADSLREIIATGDVNCRMTDGGEDRTIAGQELAVQLELSPAGERFARFIRATGGVRTKQGGDEMQAGQLDAELAPAPPATQPVATVDASDAKAAAPTNPFGGGNAQLVSLVAGGGVKLATKDGSAASADSLEVVSVNGKPQYRLGGTPAATVTQGKTVISGPAILFAPDEQLAKIDGAGGMKGTLPDDPKEWFDIAWAGGAVVNGATNLIDVTRQVVIRSVQKDGTTNTATSSRLQAKLGPKPATQPIAATRKSQSDEMNFLAGKEITAATLLADAGQRVEIKSELFAPDGALLRGVNLYADTVKTNRATGRLEIPVPGEMIVRDHRPPDGAKPDAPAPAPALAAVQLKPEGPTLGSGRGNTAFRWNESLVYDDAQRQAVMTGNVKVIHHPITKDGQPFNLWADTLTAQLEPDPTAAAAATAAANANQPPPANEPAGQQPRMRVKRVTAVGNVRVESTRLDIEAREISYDPGAQVLHARGTLNTPITVIDKETGTPTTAGELEWNTATDQFRVKDLAGKVQP